VKHQFAGLAVVELAAAIDWYAELLGRPPDMRPNEREASWQLTPASSIYVVEDPERAGRGFATLIVERLPDRDGELETVPGAGRKLTLTDPDGNRVSFARLS
jgi:hypothetical protein